MNNMNWGVWCQGLISALSDGILIAIGAVMLLEKPPDWWRLMLIAALPMAKGFFTYLKQTPPPFSKPPSEPGE